MDQLPRLGKRELICLLLFTCNYVVFVWRGFLFLWVLGMCYVILLWHSLSLPYNYLGKTTCARMRKEKLRPLHRPLLHLWITGCSALDGLGCLITQKCVQLHCSLAYHVGCIVTCKWRVLLHRFGWFSVTCH